MNEEKIILVANYSKNKKEFISSPMRITDIKIAKKDIKMQLCAVLTNEPEKLIAYTDLKLIKIMTVDKDYKILETKQETVLDYEDILKEIKEELKKIC